MPSRREQFYIGLAASAAVAVAVAFWGFVTSGGPLAAVAIIIFVGLYSAFLLIARQLEKRRPRPIENQAAMIPAAPSVRIRVANPPDGSVESYLDLVHITVTNDTDDNLPVTVEGSWGDKSTQFEWEPDQGYTLTIPPQRKGSFAFVGRLRSGGSYNYKGAQFRTGVCYLFDSVLLRSGTTGQTLPTGQRSQVRIEAHPTGHPTVASRFDVYVPADPLKPLWVMPRGEHGND